MKCAGDAPRLGDVALVGGRLVDGSGRDPIENSVVLISGRAIKDAGPKDLVELPRDAKVIDVSGRTVLPGLIDAHVHLFWGDEPTVPRGGLLPGIERSLPMSALRVFSHARRSLEMGFTTLRDCGDFGYSTVALRDAIARGLVEGPRILTTGQIITCTGGHADALPLWLQRIDDVSNVADGVDEILRAVRRQVKMFTDWVKFMATGGILDPYDEQEFTDAEMAALVSEAHSKRRPVVAHCMQSRGMLAAVKAGVQTVEHGTELTEEIAQLMVRKGTYLVPTLYASSATVKRGAQIGLPEHYRRAAQGSLTSSLASFAMARDLGVRIALGTDSGFGACSHGTNAAELELMVANGMSPMDAIVAATRTAAEALGMGRQLGVLQAGRLADLVVVEGNPLDDIALLQQGDKIALVMKEGAICTNRLCGRLGENAGRGANNVD